MADGLPPTGPGPRLTCMYRLAMGRRTETDEGLHGGTGTRLHR